MRSRRASMARIILTACFLVVFSLARTTSAEDAAVPIALQAELLTKVAAYDKNFAARARDSARIVLLTKPNDADSVRATAQMRVALAAVDRIGGLPHEESTLNYSNGAALAALVREQHISIVYVTPGLSGDIDAIRAALNGVDVLSVTAIASDVPRGIVLGFDLVSGRPKLLVNLPQMRLQNVAFSANVLKLAKVTE